MNGKRITRYDVTEITSRSIEVFLQQIEGKIKLYLVHLDTGYVITIEKKTYTVSRPLPYNAGESSLDGSAFEIPRRSLFF